MGGDAATGTRLYFAYGSNLKRARLAERVPTSRRHAIGWIEGFALCCDKPGRDGSGKANLRPSPGGRVWGAVYAMEAFELPQLDRAEGGYERIEVAVQRAGLPPLAAFTYCSALRDPALGPARWYVALMVDGAREHGLPEEAVARLAEFGEPMDHGGDGEDHPSPRPEG